MRHSRCKSSCPDPSCSWPRGLTRCDREHRQGARDRGREVIKQIPSVEIQFVEKHVNVHSVRQHPEQEGVSTSSRRSQLKVRRKKQIIQEESPQQERARCQNCPAQRTHDGAHDGNRERTVRRERSVCKSQVRGSTGHADRSSNACMSVS